MSIQDEPELHFISHDQFVADVRVLAGNPELRAWRPDFVIGIGRGGLAPAVYMSHALDRPMLSIDHSSEVPGFAEQLLRKAAAKSAAGERLLFVDDINDSGGTIGRIRDILSQDGCADDNLRFAVMVNNVRSKSKVDFWAKMIDRESDKRWFVFPWEAMATSDAIVEEALSVPERLA
ncbi:phosphoribosyltransferase [Altererythrobacter sp. B11]|uniref:phosphoribosyltransferase n=1 Tax=Altererythrobacter sp. B11 TaxID=2060312 RepID=UPI000DC72802|nr:phosphoribosyltransferase family protein [Altererythrobacter sp. B11]BBC73840.1 phosphoribosyltransferase [Altererythrobacter sp. B11]